MLSRESGASVVTRSEVFVLEAVRLSRVVSCSVCTCVGRVGLGTVMVSEDCVLLVFCLLVGLLG